MQRSESGVQPATQTKTRSPKTTKVGPDPGKPRPATRKQAAAKTKVLEAPTPEVDVQQLIAARAYELWESQGRPHGYDVVNWQQAEQDIMASRGDGALPPKAKTRKATTR